ncbi:glycosyltransferase family 4 protein [Gracilimonas sp. BCB1]|uniref:glycosyltransferase family 4 protein n=1 Tax=Gracilimonas sp. BCB1 TaxID=3152362 RepID=UPI0032D99D88
MRVGYVSPMSIAAVNGGLRNQALQTTKHITSFGAEPYLISPWDDIKEMDLDLVHVFGASIENVGIVDQIKAMGLPLALSPVFFSNRNAAFIKRALKMEQLSSAFGSGIRSDFSVKTNLCRKADVILPNTSAEADLIRNGFSIPDDQIRVIPNGVEQKFADAKPDLFIETYGLKDFVLFAGQAGAERKNVIKLLEVANEVDAPLVIIGSFYRDQYGKKCIILANKAGNVTLIDTLDHDSELLASAYAASSVFVLPSQFETPGIAAMEAALAGSKIVITGRGGTKDYFDGYAEFINPDSSKSILNGIKEALNKASSDSLKNHLLEKYSWQRVAELTANQYKRISA